MRNLIKAWPLLVIIAIATAAGTVFLTMDTVQINSDTGKCVSVTNYKGEQRSCASSPVWAIYERVSQ